MVDNMVYANIFPPKEGFVKYADYLSLENVEKWRNGSPLAPFDKEVRSFYVSSVVLIVTCSRCM